MPDGTARQFTFELDAKSVISTPSGGQQLAGPGFYEIRGLAWSGRGLVQRVEVSPALPTRIGDLASACVMSDSKREQVVA
jgi:hypothetical protein